MHQRKEVVKTAFLRIPNGIPLKAFSKEMRLLNFVARGRLTTCIVGQHRKMKNSRVSFAKEKNIYIHNFVSNWYLLTVTVAFALF